MFQWSPLPAHKYVQILNAHHIWEFWIKRWLHALWKSRTLSDSKKASYQAPSLLFHKTLKSVELEISIQLRLSVFFRVSCRALESSSSIRNKYPLNLVVYNVRFVLPLFLSLFTPCSFLCCLPPFSVSSFTFKKQRH